MSFFFILQNYKAFFSQKQKTITGSEELQYIYICSALHKATTEHVTDIQPFVEALKNRSVLIYISGIFYRDKAKAE